MSLSAKKFFYGIALTIAAVTFFGCSQPTDPPVDITWTAAADGVSGTTTSTKINVTLAGAVTGLTAEQITLTNVTGAATKGAISGDGANWSLGVTVETAGDITLAIDKAGVESGAKTITVHKQAAAPAAVAYTVAADGESNTTASTKINFTFDAAVTGLAAEQITLTSGTGTVTKAALTGSGANWSLGITVDTAGDITVVITKDGIASGAKTVTVHKQGETTPDPVAYIAAADGENGITSSTKIDFTFDAAVTGLTAEDIAVTPGTGSITTGALTGSGVNWSLAITVETAGNVKLAINKPGIVHTEKDLTVYALPALTDMVSPGLGSGGGWVEGNISGEGAAQIMTLTVVEEPLAYFGIIKSAEQAITVGGTDAAKVTPVAKGETLGGRTASDTAALFTVNMEDLLFDGAFGETDTFNADAIPIGTETRTFTLTVDEAGKISREIAVSLNMTLDQATETSIYHREGTEGTYHYVKVRDAALTDADKTPSAVGGETDFEAFTTGAVTDLQNAFVWVDHHGLGGTGHNGFESGTTEGYSEYRLFLKKSQQIGKMGFIIYNGAQDTRDNMSIELYGAGPVAKQLNITRNPTYSVSRSAQMLNYQSGANGFISLVDTETYRPSIRYKALVLGKNITIDAEGSAENPFTQSGNGPWRTLRVECLIDVGINSMFIMNNDSMLTGCYDLLADSSFSTIKLGENADSGEFYMNGGTIADNIILNFSKD
jgi:hypothetical protein